MTAVVSVKATTREERLIAARNAWIQEAMNYMFKLGIYDAIEEAEGANELAEILWDGSDNEEFFDDHTLFMSPSDAVDEELTYWGD
jgi:hypothetical protein